MNRKKSVKKKSSEGDEKRREGKGRYVVENGVRGTRRMLHAHCRCANVVQATSTFVGRSVVHLCRAMHSGGRRGL